CDYITLVCYSFFFTYAPPPPLIFTLFPYTTLFRSKLFPEDVPGNDYYDYASEYFAEAMAMYFLDNAQTDKLEERAPETYQFIGLDRKSTRLNSSHVSISYAVFCLKKKI